MVEFGEQLRKAREAKGMTQQTLAEHLYVTRQAVSRWECGDRYPDLVTVKKLATFLEVSLDDLLSINEMEKVAERSPVIEKPLMKNVLITLYAFVSFSFLLTVIDILIRFPTSLQEVNYGDVQFIVVNLLGLVIQIIIFVSGFIMALKEELTPRKTGIMMVIYFASICLTNTVRVRIGLEFWKIVIGELLTVLPSLLAAVASYQYLCKGKNQSVWYRIIIIVSIWEIFLIMLNIYSVIRYATEFVLMEFVSMNTALSLLLRICIYLLIIYQVYIVKHKRDNAADIVARQKEMQ